jgi:hypothetical protein
MMCATVGPDHLQIVHRSRRLQSIACIMLMVLCHTCVAASFTGPRPCHLALSWTRSRCLVTPCVSDALQKPLIALSQCTYAFTIGWKLADGTLGVRVMPDAMLCILELWLFLKSSSLRLTGVAALSPTPLSSGGISGGLLPSRVTPAPCMIQFAGSWQGVDVPPAPCLHLVICDLV